MTQHTVTERTLEEITRLLPEDASASAVKLITHAWEFAQKSHGSQQRRSGEPHTEHLYQTARNLSALGMDSTVIAAGILHDVIEDTDVDYEQLAQEFGEEIAFLVDGVTKLKKQHMRQEERQIESLRKMLIATARDPRIVIIKLCDRLHNMQTLQYMPPNKQLRIARETLDMYVPVAERLSMGAIRRELEELAFPYAYPNEHREMQILFNEILPTRRVEAERIKNAIGLFQDKNIIEVRIRNKSLYTFHRKLERLDHDLSSIQDIAAVQVIVPSIDDCYAMLGLVHTVGRPYPGKMKDFIAFPRPNGYRSLRTTIQMNDGLPVEVQIFTPALFRYAQRGNVHATTGSASKLEPIKEFFSKFNIFRSA